MHAASLQAPLAAVPDTSAVQQIKKHHAIWKAPANLSSLHRHSCIRAECMQLCTYGVGEEGVFAKVEEQLETAWRTILGQQALTLRTEVMRARKQGEQKKKEWKRSRAAARHCMGSIAAHICARHVLSLAHRCALKCGMQDVHPQMC
eukprot:94957-Pelagomonas_calceolata.AAC.4